MDLKPLLIALVSAALLHAPAHAEPPEAAQQAQAREASSDEGQPDLFGRATHQVQGVMNSGLQYLGIPYRFGGSSAETGFDCSGLVRRIFSDALGLNLPRSAREMASMGKQVGRNELKPGDLVFFNTMRRTFSHVGIYLGDDRFLHSPSAGGRVRVDNLNEAYWQRTFNGARRLIGGEAAANSIR
ncbi:C40 family peptidase [Niveibacterium terrae]|uniref:C40 family peptidase n=1 Tax=Niveibacterium terrae TaxID=3373598 RepID=UPI003A8FED0C